MEENRKKPQVRFDGYTDDWEQRKLGDEAIEMVAGGDIDKSLLDEHGKYPVIANALTDDGIVGYYASDYRIKAPAVTVTGRGDVGHAKARTVDFTPVVRLLSVRSKHDVFFLENAINTLNVIVESTGVPQLTVPQLSQYEIFFPPTITEEKEIGAFFDRVDNLITLHQRKHNKLVDVKKSMLEKMFPKNGEKKPEIRFCGFTDDWEQRKVTELLKNTSDAIKIGPFGSALKKSFFTDKGIKVYAQENAFSGDFSIGNYYISEAKYNELKSCELKPGDLVISMMGTVGACAIFPENAEKGIMNSHLLRLQFSEEVLPEYIMFLLRDSQIIRGQIDRLSVGSIMTGLSSTVVKKLVFPVPKRPEQQKIVELLEQLDNLITLHQRKAKMLQFIKIIMVEKMFVS